MADINMNMLNACADVRTLYDKLSSRTDFSCRAPRGSLERGLLKRMGVNPQARNCFVNVGGLESLRDMSCLQTSMHGTNEMFCFRGADEDDVDAYKRDFRSGYASKVETYLQQARGCNASNGDVSVAQKSLAPAQLSLIGQFEIGFTMGLGRTDPTTATYLHGYASLDPDLPSGDTTAIEFTFMLVGGNLDPGAGLPTRTVGNMTVLIDPLRELTQSLKGQMEQQGIPIALHASSMDFKRQGGPLMSEESKASRLEAWMDELADAVTAQGFSEVPDQQLRRLSGLSRDRWIDRMVENQPYGTRDDVRAMLDEHLKVLVNTSHSCVRTGQDALMAIVAGTKPMSGVRNDYGSVVLFTMGIASCGRTDRYLTSVVENSVEAVLKAVRLER
jgi:hypothetical protein